MMNKGYLTAKSTPESDEWYTPAYGVRPIIKYLKPNSTIWCPFDTEESFFYKLLKEAGHNVILSHKNEGKDFFTWQPEQEYDYIVSNPPYSIKDKVIERLFEIDKPYAIVVPIYVLSGQKRFKWIKDCEALIFDIRIHFLKPGEEKYSSRVSFPSIYLCKNILPEKLIFEHLERD